MVFSDLYKLLLGRQIKKFNISRAVEIKKLIHKKARNKNASNERAAAQQKQKIQEKKVKTNKPPRNESINKPVGPGRTRGCRIYSHSYAGYIAGHRGWSLKQLFKNKSQACRGGDTYVKFYAHYNLFDCRTPKRTGKRGKRTAGSRERTREK